MKISIISDVHTEKSDYDFSKSRLALAKGSDIQNMILILAGDIGTLEEPSKLIKFLRYTQSLYKIIIYVPGNHEYDGPMSIEKTDKLLRGLCSYLNETRLNDEGIIYFLNCDILSLRIDERRVKILGNTLWSKPYNVEGEELRDTKVLQLNNKLRDKIHNKHCQWIENNVSGEEFDEIWVITHHAPSFKLLNDGDDYEERTYYASSCEYLFNNVDRWVFGHTHIKTKIKMNNTTLYNNPVGYINDNINIDHMYFDC